MPLKAPARSATFAGAMGHGNHPPAIPEVRDEAGASPSWLPYLGLGLLALFVAWIVYSHAG
jgi:hypothetical protein